MDKYEKDLHFFHAMQLKDLKDRCSSYGHRVIDHLVRCYLFPESGSIKHWIHEIINWIHEVSTQTIKSGKFKYQYLFQDYQPFNQRNIEGFIDHAQYKEQELVPKDFDNWKSIAQYLNRIIDTIERLQGKSSKILADKEIELIILNNLKESKRL